MAKHPTIDDAKALCRKYSENAVLILAFGDGQYGAASYGADRQRCKAMAGVLDWIVEQIKAKKIEIPDCLRLKALKSLGKPDFMCGPGGCRTKPQVAAQVRTMPQLDGGAEARAAKEVEEALELCDEIENLAENVPDRGYDFAVSVTETMAGIRETIERMRTVTKAQWRALENMLEGLARWVKD